MRDEVEEFLKRVAQMRQQACRLQIAGRKRERTLQPTHDGAHHRPAHHRQQKNARAEHHRATEFARPRHLPAFAGFAKPFGGGLFCSLLAFFCHVSAPPQRPRRP